MHLERVAARVCVCVSAAVTASFRAEEGENVDVLMMGLTAATAFYGASEWLWPQALFF